MGGRGGGDEEGEGGRVDGNKLDDSTSRRILCNIYIHLLTLNLYLLLYIYIIIIFIFIYIYIYI